MKELKRIFVFFFIIGLVLFVLIGLLTDSLLSVEVNILEIAIVSVASALVFAAILLRIVSSLLRPKLKFLKSEELQVPEFGDKQQKVISITVPEFSFEVIKYRIKENYNIVVYDDAEHYVVKFCSKILFNSWGTAGVAVYDAVTRKVTLTCFPLCAHSEKAMKNTQQMFDKVEKLIY